MKAESGGPEEESGKEVESVYQEARTCPVCGTKFFASADREFCPVCILNRAFRTESAVVGTSLAGAFVLLCATRSSTIELPITLVPATVEVPSSLRTTPFGQDRVLTVPPGFKISVLALAIFVTVDFLYVSGPKASEEAGFNAKLVAQAANQADQDAYIAASLGGYPRLTSYPQEFSAEVTTTYRNGDPTTHIWVYRQADKERTDSPSQDPQTTIVLRSENKAWNIWSKSDSHSLYYADSVVPPYSIVELAVDPSFPPDNDHVYTKVGVETVNGQVCDKYTFTSKSGWPNGPGTSWVSQETKLPVRVISHLYETEYTTDITNVTVRPLESSLFSPPKGGHQLRRHPLKWMWPLPWRFRKRF